MVVIRESLPDLSIHPATKIGTKTEKPTKSSFFLKKKSFIIKVFCLVFPTKGPCMLWAYEKNTCGQSGPPDDRNTLVCYTMISRARFSKQHLKNEKSLWWCHAIKIFGPPAWVAEGRAAFYIMHSMGVTTHSWLIEGCVNANWRCLVASVI